MKAVLGYVSVNEQVSLYIVLRHTGSMQLWLLALLSSNLRTSNSHYKRHTHTELTQQYLLHMTGIEVFVSHLLWVMYGGAELVECPFV